MPTFRLLDYPEPAFRILALFGVGVSQVFPQVRVAIVPDSFLNYQIVKLLVRLHALFGLIKWVHPGYTVL
jgi:hypothetical protein